ncbi:MAG: V-type ATP synthase subunit K [Clostridiales bacterium]|nr:V-type ATP synthase subunit K [Clostridiales bacterium]
MELGIALALFGAVIAAGLSGAGSAVALGMAGQAAAAVVAEDPKKFGQTLVLQAVGTTNGIYGLLMGFLILNKAMEVTDWQTGLFLLGAGIPIGVVGYIAAVAQGKTMVTGIILIGKKSGELAKALIYAAMVETFAVFALLISFLMYNMV